MAITEVAINSTINASNNKALFEVFYIENIWLPIDFLLLIESSINPHAYTFASKMQ